MQGDERQPFGLVAGPAEGRELAGAVLQRRNHDGARHPRHQRAIAAHVRDEDAHRVDDPFA